MKDQLILNKVCEGFLPIIPQPKQSARFFSIKGKNGKNQIRSYTDPQKKKYILDLSNLFTEKYCGDIIEKPLKFTGYLNMPFLKSQKKSDLKRGWCLHSVKPDVDNLLKPFFDSLEGSLYKNDSQICWHDVIKIRSEVVGIHYKFETVEIF